MVNSFEFRVTFTAISDAPTAPIMSSFSMKAIRKTVDFDHFIAIKANSIMDLHLLVSC